MGCGGVPKRQRSFLGFRVSLGGFRFPVRGLGLAPLRGLVRVPLRGFRWRVYL